MLGAGRNKPMELPAAPLALTRCLAKSCKTERGEVLAGRLVLSHCRVVGEVARAMIARMPEWLRLALFPDGAELIAAAHDIGKVSPTFQHKIYRALTSAEISVLTSLKIFDPDTEKNWGGHAGVSQVTADALGVGKFIPEILGQHHGFSPNLILYQANSAVFGGESWNQSRIDLLSQLKQILACDFPVVSSPCQAKVLAGLTTVSDWIGSGSLFDDAESDSPAKIEQALNIAGYIQPQLKHGLSFFDVFGFMPKDTQTKLISVANQPGVYVLEAPMGLGKTEAALYAAYQLLEKKSATGIYFALPTQLTSDNIFERVNDFLKKILQIDSPHQQALLLHGNAWLKQFEIGEEGNPGGAWFAQGKRGILAPFAVGTIDQALMAVMNVKHGFVRTFGLAGKVVILDEVHSYDSYTGTILDTLVQVLRELHCTVIILSATLTQERRTKLLNVIPQKSGYPLITAQPNAGELAEIEAVVIPDVIVTIAHETEADAIEEALRRSEAGQQVLWIENTVKDAQERYQLLSARAQEIGIACGLLHSRFTKMDRAVNEGNWVNIFGKSGADQRGHQGRILVGTQVLEQSLDIDADFMVTRIAPTDMLLQRLGRLWRHGDTPRPLSASREAWILSPDLITAMADPHSAFGATAKVYAPYVLCRSLQIWQNIKEVKLPSEIRTLIEASYAPRDENVDMEKLRNLLEQERTKLSTLALIGLSTGGKTLPEEKAQTRYSELETTEVLLIRSFQHDTSKHGTWVILLEGRRLWVPYNGRSLSNQWREISAILMQNSLKVADYLAPNAIKKSQITWLGDYFYLGKPEYNESDMLRVALVGDDGTLTALDGGPVNDKYWLSYNAKFGYLSKKRS